MSEREREREKEREREIGRERLHSYVNLILSYIVYFLSGL